MEEKINTDKQNEISTQRIQISYFVRQAFQIQNFKQNSIHSENIQAKNRNKNQNSKENKNTTNLRGEEEYISKGRDETTLSSTHSHVGISHLLPNRL